MPQLKYTDEQVNDAVKWFQSIGIRRPFKRNSMHPYEWLKLCETVEDYYKEANNEIYQFNILEIGVYLYTSSCAFLRFMETHKNVYLWSIDPIHNRGRLGQNTFIYPDESANSRWCRCIGKSQDIVKMFLGNFVSVALIDGDHKVEAVRADFENVTRCLGAFPENDGILIAHDTDSPPLREALLSVEPNGWTFYDSPRISPRTGMGVWRPTQC